MKRFAILLLFVLIIVFSLHSSYSPWVSFTTGMDTVFYESKAWPSLSYGIEVSMVSFTFGRWTVSAPVRLESVTASLPQNGTITMEHNKIKCGLGGEYRNRLFYLSSFFYLGVVDYSPVGGVGREVSISVTPGLQLEEHFALLFPLTYNFSSYYPSFNLQVAIKMGGKV